ncbi:MAG: Ldh family oxidoreductase [Deltaproteobacteria bacterium]|nr:Ldh family oxidoreductase [Deltaproteobacteria bacterium]
MNVRPEKLKQVIVEILRGFGASEAEAEIVADNMVFADMRGVDTHGVHFLTLVADRVKAGMIRIPTPLSVIRDEGATGLIDGGDGLGQVAACRAMEMSIKKARQFGVGTVLVRNANNIGSLAFYTLLAARNGMVGIVSTNGAPSISPWGGTEPFFGTNPISIAVPVDSGNPVVLDMSASVVARGKIRKAERMKEAIPLGWATDETGTPTTDPAAAMKGTLLPIGGPKGYGMAFMADVMAGLLSGSQFGPAVKTFHQPLGPTGVGVFTMAIDIGRFMPLEQFKGLIQTHTSSIRASKKAHGVERIYLPGEIEAEKEKKSRAEGIPLDAAVTERLSQLLKEVKSNLCLSGD